MLCPTSTTFLTTIPIPSQGSYTHFSCRSISKNYCTRDALQQCQQPFIVTLLLV